MCDLQCRTRIGTRLNRGAVLGALALVVLIAVGCGSDSETSGSGSVQNPDRGAAKAADRDAVPTLALRSSVLSQAGGLARVPDRYRCRKNEIWLPLEWSKPPAGTYEITLVTEIHRPARAEVSASTLQTEWVVGGLPPTTRKLQVGRLPKGAFITGRQGGPPDCPSQLEESRVVYSLLALPPDGFHAGAGERIDSEMVEALSDGASARGQIAMLYGGEAGRPEAASK